MKTESIIQVIPNDGPLGAEITGVDLSREVASETIERIRSAWLEHIVIVFRNQNLTDQELIRFGQYFGELHRVEYQDRERPSGVPTEIEIVSNIVEDGRPLGLLGNAEVAWHTDMSMWEEPASATILYGQEVPSHGGGTRFCNLYLAYEELDEGIKSRIRHRKSIHDSAYMADGNVRAGYEQIRDKSQGPGARHPIVCTHPESGRESLYLGRKGYGYIVGLPVDESDTLLDALWEHMVQPRYVWEHQWRQGDVLMWDNRCTAHSRGSIASDQRRLLRRVTVKGAAPR
jgi:taurine dioxygenase